MVDLSSHKMEAPKTNTHRTSTCWVIWCRRSQACSWRTSRIRAQLEAQHQNFKVCHQGKNWTRIMQMCPKVLKSQWREISYKNKKLKTNNNMFKSTINQKIRIKVKDSIRSKRRDCRNHRPSNLQTASKYIQKITFFLWLTLLFHHY